MVPTLYIQYFQSEMERKDKMQPQSQWVQCTSLSSHTLDLTLQDAELHCN